MQSLKDLGKFNFKMTPTFYPNICFRVFRKMSTFNLDLLLEM